MSKLLLLFLMLFISSQAATQTVAATNESDYLSDMPIVLSVSRLPQRLDETPGAVTILDREMIRLSGARDVADLMRLVPGFQTSTSFERIAPQASYHGAFTSYANHLQVLVDGRSVYSPYFVGSTEAGLQTVALEDIERIEVLRGSNSAAYGARAMLGVINIVTRHTGDTVGAAMGLAVGQNGVGDVRASFGWGQPGASFRLGVDRRGDDGLKGSNGHSLISRVNFRADLAISPQDEIQFRLGNLGIDAGKGNTKNPGDPFRDQVYDSSHLQLDWKRVFNVDEDLAFHYSRNAETYDESFPLVYFGICCVDVNASGQSTGEVLSVQHSVRRNQQVRFVWGGELRSEKITSKGLYDTRSAFVTNFSRLFGNVEWRIQPGLVMNAGAMAEKSSVSGDSLAPRLMLNWHLEAGQTLRAGVSRAFRPPSTFEKYANVQFYLNDIPLQKRTMSSGNVQSEQVMSRELGYLGDFPQWKINMDARLFNEQMVGLITQVDNGFKDYTNNDNFSIKGLEYQMKWSPWAGGQLMLNQSYTNISSLNLDRALAAPRLLNSLAFFQKFEKGLVLSLMHQNSTPSILAGSDEEFKRRALRSDLRISLPMRFGAQKGEVAMVVQNLGSPYFDFHHDFQFERRAFVTFRVEH